MSADAARPGRRRARRWPVVVTVGVVLVAAAAGGWVLVARDSGASETPSYTTATASRATLTDSVEADFTLSRSSAATLTSPASGTVTKLRTKVGAKLGALTPLFDVNGTTIRGIPSTTPLYRDLAEGDDGPDVKALQQALSDTGYDPGDIDGDFGSETTDALTEWQSDNDLDETGKLSMSSFVWYQPKATLLDLPIEVGDKAGPSTTAATVGQPSAVVADAEVSQLDIDQVKVGQSATLTLDADTDSTFQARVTEVAAEASAGDEAAAGSSTVIRFAVTLTPTKLPETARVGMTGQADVIVRTRKNVIVVPSAAVQGSDSSPTVQVLSGSTPESRPVVAGMSTASSTEIVTGLREGETVVTGVISRDSDAGTQQGQQGGFPGGGFPGGGPPGGGPPGGGGFGGGQGGTTGGRG